MTDEARKIIAALRVVCDDRVCTNCPCFDWCNKNKMNCLDDDAADLIEKLSADLEEARAMLQEAREHAELFMEELTQVKRERDAAVADIDMCCPCEVCTRNCTYDKVNPYDECVDFEWRGVKNDA